jgi:hypothetical protein
MELVNAVCFVYGESVWFTASFLLWPEPLGFGPLCFKGLGLVSGTDLFCFLERQRRAPGLECKQFGII